MGRKRDTNMTRGSLQLEAKATVPSFAKAIRRTRKLGSFLVHHFRDWYSSVAIKMGRQQDATKEPI
jgi:hypothetical protein